MVMPRSTRPRRIVTDAAHVESPDAAPSSNGRILVPRAELAAAAVMIDLKRDGEVWLLAASVVAVLFGLLTISAGGSVLFGDEEARRSAGAYVGFVLWFNFLAGFAYVAAGTGLWARRRWAAALAFLVAAATLLIFAAFGAYVATGAAYEARTVAAMSVRTLVWLVISWIGYRWIWRRD